MITKTHGILLRTFPYSESSLVAAWLTRDGGRTTTLVKGAQRPKSHFLGHLDLFYTCEILYYEKSTRTIHLLKECTPLADRRRLRTDWRACAAASYLAFLYYRISPAQAHHAGLYEQLNWALDYVNDRSATPAFLFWYELKLLGLLGLAPRLRQCAECRKSLEPSARGALFAYDHGGIRCSRCAQPGARHTVRISPAVLAMLAGWQRARTPQITSNTRVSSEHLHEMGAVLGRFIQYHLELPLQSREVALDLLRRRPGVAASHGSSARERRT